MLRRLHQSLGFTVTAVLTLGAGIAAIVTMFSVYSGAVLNPLTVAQPDTLLSLFAANHKINFVPPTLSWLRFDFVRRTATTFSQLGAYSSESVSLSEGAGLPEQLRGLRVSGDFFGALRSTVEKGRLFTAEEDFPNGPKVCILSNEFWHSHFGGRELVGTVIQLDGKSTEVVGILSPRMSPPWADRQIFLPRVFEDSALAQQPNVNASSFLEVVGRLKPNVTPLQAALDVRRVSEAYASEFAGRADANNEIEVRSLVDTVVGNRRGVLSALLAAVLLVLLVSCANVGALFLSRLISRQRELAVKQALGATRALIVRQILGESLTVACCAGLSGVFLAIGMLRAIPVAAGGQLPPGIVLRLDGPALAVAIVVVFVSAFLVGWLPALHVTRPSTSSPLVSSAKGMSEGAATRRLRSALVICEVMLSVLLLVTAAHLLASVIRLQQTSPGFEPLGVAAAFATLPAERYPTPERQIAFFTGVLDRIAANPQVTGAAVVFGLPFHDENYAGSYAVFGRPILPPSDRARAGLRIVTENYFSTMRIRLLEGRSFTNADRAGSKGVCIINSSLARRQFGGRSPIGQTILRGRNADQAFEVIGVTADVKTNGLRDQTPDEIFYPFRQLPRPIAAVVARSTIDPELLRPLFQSAVSAVDPYIPIYRFAPMQRRLEATLAPDRMMAGLTSVFAGIALLLASVGLYALLAHSVTARTVEIGIRLALGSGRRDIVRLMLSQAMRLVAMGIGSGLLASAMVSPLLAKYLFGVNAREPLVYGVVAAVFVVVGIAATVAPALRASRVDPLISLRAS